MVQRTNRRYTDGARLVTTIYREAADPQDIHLADRTLREDAHITITNTHRGISTSTSDSIIRLDLQGFHFSVSFFSTAIPSLEVALFNRIKPKKIVTRQDLHIENQNHKFG